MGFDLEQALQASLVLGGKAGDDGAGTRLVGKREQGGGRRADEAAVGVLEHETQLGRGAQAGVGPACVVERPAHEMLDETLGEAWKWCALSAGKRDNDGCAVQQAVVE